MKKFSVVVCSYNGERCLRRTLDQILHQDELQTLVTDIVLVDNKSSDHTADIMKEYADKYALVKYVYEPNPGLSNARLCGFQNARGSWIIYVDDDNYLDSNWLTEMNRTVEDHPDAGILGGAVIPYTDFPMNQDQEATLHVTYIGLACTELTRDSIKPGCVNPAQSVVGAGMTVRREILDYLVQNGWLKEMGRTGNNLASGEDSEICEAAHTLNYSIYRQTDSVMLHDIPPVRLTEDYTMRLYSGLYQAMAKRYLRKDGLFLTFVRAVYVRLKHWMFRIKHSHGTDQEKLRIRLNEILDDKISESLESFFRKTR